MDVWARGHMGTWARGCVGAGRGRRGGKADGSRHLYLNSPTSTPRTIFNYISDCKQRNKYPDKFFFFNESHDIPRTRCSSLKILGRVMAPSATISHEVHYQGNVGLRRHCRGMYIFIIKNVKPFILRSQNNH